MPNYSSLNNKYEFSILKGRERTYTMNYKFVYLSSEILQKANPSFQIYKEVINCSGGGLMPLGKWLRHSP